MTDKHTHNKQIHKEQSSHKDKEDSVNIDLTNVKEFYKKNSKTILTVTLILIPIILSIFFRAYPAYLPATDEWAEDSVYSNIQSNILSQINQQYPNLPNTNKNKLVDEEFNKALKNNKDEIDKQVTELSSYFKSRMQDDSGQTYLLAIDPYFYLRHVNNYLEYGHAGTVYTNEIEDSSAQEIRSANVDFSKKASWDGQRLAPVGTPTSMSFNAYFGLMVHKFLSLFNKDQSPMASMFLIPIIICSLAVIPAFLIGRKLAGNIGGFLSATMLAINANLLGRTAGGFSDTDSYNILFPLLIAWLFIESLIQKSIKKRIIFASLAGLATGLFAFAWVGWWYFFDFIIGSIVIYLAYLIIKDLTKNKKIKEILKEKSLINYLKSAVTYVLSTGVFVSLFSSFKIFIKAPIGPLNFLLLKQVATQTLWPTIRTTVAELNSASFNQVLNSVGGSLFFWIAVLGIILPFVMIKKNKEISIQMSILLSLWFIGTIFASKSGIRFVLLLTPAFTIAFGIAIGLLYKKLMVWTPKALGIKKNATKIMLLIIIALLLIAPLRAADSVAKREIPNMNDAWYNTLTKISTETPEDSIINSWWDFGHWFITIGDRQVTFDGAGQDSYMAYWVGRSLLSNSEEKTLGILRMVDCGNNNAFIVLDGQLEDTPKSIDILNNIITMNKNSAKQELLNYIPEETAEEVLKYSHCEAPENYYITSNDMVGKSGVWAHFGSWDFNRASMYKSVKKLNEAEGTQLLTLDFGLDQESANSYYYQIQNTEADQWIAPWPNYVSNKKSCQVNEEGIICNINVGGQQIPFIIDSKTMETKVYGSNDEVYPYSLVYATETGIMERKYDSPGIPYTIALIPEENGFSSVMMMPELALSTFTKLYYYGGHGQNCFSLFNEARQVTGGDIYTWKVDWTCQQTTNIFEPAKAKNSEEIRASHILIKTDTRTSEEALAEITNIQNMLTDDNFGALAQEYSEGPSSAAQGDLGYFGKGLMVKEFEDSAFELEVGEILEPVETQFGWHLIQRVE
ncbi:MAG: peptidylprolyl isomerase [Nanoarchaeota archaeon]|nr:peptidylprolyl isomerase [Nanoarchaeota archaeon]